MGPNTGDPGVAYSSDTTTNGADDWEGGDLAEPER
jgi:hypothetical protein